MTGKLNAARYYFLLSTYCEWNLLIYSINLISSYCRFSYSFFLSSFFLLISITFCACSKYNEPIFYFQYCIYLSLALFDSSAIFCFFYFCCDWKFLYIYYIFFLCDNDIFFNYLASSNLTKYIAFCIFSNYLLWLYLIDLFLCLNDYIFSIYELSSFCFYNFYNIKKKVHIDWFYWLIFSFVWLI